MPDREKHGSLIFNGLGARRWEIDMACDSASLKKAILNIYPRLRTVAGYNLWFVNKEGKFEILPDKANTPRRIKGLLGPRSADCLLIVPVSDISLMEENLEKLHHNAAVHQRELNARQPQRQCLVCGRSGRSQGGFHSILEDRLPTAGSPPILEKMNQAFGFSIRDQMKAGERGEDVCKKCFKTLIEMVELEEKLKRTKEGLMEAFFNTTVKVQRLAAAEEKRVSSTAESQLQNTPIDFSRSNSRLSIIPDYSQLKISGEYDANKLPQPLYIPAKDYYSKPEGGYPTSQSCYSTFPAQTTSSTPLIPFYHPLSNIRREYVPFPTTTTEDTRSNVHSDEEESSIRERMTSLKAEERNQWKEEADSRWKEETDRKWIKYEENSLKYNQSEDLSRPASPRSSGYESAFSSSTHESMRPMKKRKHVTEAESFSDVKTNSYSSSSNSEHNSRSTSNGSCNDNSLTDMENNCKNAEQ